MRVWLLLAALAAGSGCAHFGEGGARAVRLDELLAFSNPSLCESAPPHSHFLGGMMRGDANEGFRAGHILVPTSFRRAFGRIKVVRHEYWWTVGVPVSGTLFGLKLTRIEQDLPQGGDPGGVTYSFDAPAAEVENALRAAGFPAKGGADVSLGPPEGYDHVMSLTADPSDPGRTHFRCGYQ